MTGGPGKARAVKGRLTLLARQGLEGLFGQGPEPSLQNLKGKILDSVLIVHCEQRCRLELISESGTWTKTHSFWENGEHRVRQEGEKVKPQSLMKSWRELRRRHPALLQKGVRVWGQPTAYMDEVICAWHSELIQDEAERALLSQD